MPRASEIRPNEPTRLYVKGAVLGYRRSKVLQYPSCSLIQIEGVKTRKDTQFYLGKKVAYITKASRTRKQTNATKNTKFNVIWGKVCSAHGDNGVVKCRFRHNLPPSSFGATVRVMLYPSNV